MTEKEFSFEQGPIRPPSEARSLLLRVTRNCPWNQCLFCRTYKKRKFSLRTVEEIKADIRTARDMADDIRKSSFKIGAGGNVDDRVISSIFGNSGISDSYRSVAAWMYNGTGSCFLQDADNLIMKTKDMVEVLEFLREKFPEITRVTSYSRSRTIIRKSVESLKKIRKAGLNRVHIGLESGYDPLLKFIKKGVTAAQHIEAGQKVVEAGMEVSEYVMPGLGGQAMWREHAVETANVLNQINPHFIRFRSLRVLPILPLHKIMMDGDFVVQTDDMVVKEIKLFLESLNGITSTVTSDHITNLLEEIDGKLPQDKEKMLDVIRKYQELPDSERLIYRVGRRGGAFRSVDDLKFDTATYGKIDNLINDIVSKEGVDGIERFITEMADRYM
ncbi:MAG: radical SAM protein [Deltaproteobacteria bacterium]|nr:radical SAM protein [Deltaproteobacteria bacterium]